MKLQANLIIIGCAVFATYGALVPEAPRMARLAVPAKLGEFPCFALIKKNGNPMCGGALISRTHVLTAAHCISDLISDLIKIRSLTVEVGTVSVGSGKTHTIRRFAHHRYFSMSADISVVNPNDVAVITLSTPVTESPGVKPISLPSPWQETPANTRTFVCGFGSAEYGKPLVRFLQKAEMSIVPLEECQKYYKALTDKLVEPSKLCAKGGLGHGTCTGDSGGPLTYNDQVIGIVSSGDGLCSNGLPDIYTKVSHFIPYIQSELKYDFKSNNGSNEQSIGVDIK